MFDQLWQLIRRSHATEAVLALDQVRTVAGAQAIHTAESNGLRRGIVLRACERRIAQLRGEDETKAASTLIAQGEAVEKPPAGRIVAAVGYGRPHPRRFMND